MFFFLDTVRTSLGDREVLGATATGLDAVAPKQVAR